MYSRAGHIIFIVYQSNYAIMCITYIVLSLNNKYYFLHKDIFRHVIFILYQSLTRFFVILFLSSSQLVYVLMILWFKQLLCYSVYSQTSKCGGKCNMGTYRCPCCCWHYNCSRLCTPIRGSLMNKTSHL